MGFAVKLWACGQLEGVSYAQGVCIRATALGTEE